MGTTAVIPLKTLASAKRRLAVVLGDAQRRHVVEAMAAHVIDMCSRCSSIEDVLVVAGDAEAAAVARRCGVAAMVVPDIGLEAAMSAADQRLADRRETLVVVADLPHLTAADLDAVVEAGGSDEIAVVIAPTHDGGTAALLRRPPTVISTAYGPDSARIHADRAARAGIRAAVVAREGLAFDLDTPAQLGVAFARRTGDDVGCRPR